MIITKIGMTNLNGNAPEIMADYCAITDTIFEFLTEIIGMDVEQAKADLKTAFDMALEMTDQIIQ